ncbi:MAG: ATP-binding protein [Pseudomonadota bacterium]
MAGLTSLTLSRGFAAYLDDRDKQRLDEFVAEAQALVEADPVAGMANVVLLIPDRRPDRPPRGPRLRDGAGPGAPPTAGPPRPRPPEPGERGFRPRPVPPPGFLPRLSLYDLDGKRLAGPPLRRTTTGVVRRPIMRGDQMIGEVVLLPLGPSPEGIETDFLREQLTGIVVLLLLIVALAGIAAYLIARRGAAALEDIQSVASNVANGDFSKRAQVSGGGEIADLANNINRMTETLGNLQQARRTWLAEVGHELRTPLTVLHGELEALREGLRPLDAAAIRSLDDEAHRISLLVDDLQFMALSDLTRPTFAFAAVSVSQIIAASHDRFHERCTLADLSLTLHNRVPADQSAQWDEKRVEQLLANLISNACAYTDAPGAIVITAQIKMDHVEIIVEDSAPGVESANLGRLFDPLFRVEKSRARNLGGSGLGLAVCSVIADGHHGSIQAHPSALGGLKICVTLPMHPVVERSLVIDEHYG